MHRLARTFACVASLPTAAIASGAAAAPPTPTPAENPGTQPAEQEAEDPQPTQSLDDIFRNVFGRARPDLTADDYVVRVDSINAGSFSIEPPTTDGAGGSVDSSFVELILLPTLIEDLHDEARRIGAAEKVSFDALRDLGLTVAFDQRMLVLEVGIPARLKTTRTINLRALARSAGIEFVNQAQVSGYLNLRGGIDILEDSSSRGTGIDRKAVDIDGAIRIGAITLEAGGSYDSRRSNQKWQRDDILLSHDDRETLIRYEIGDLSIGKRPFQGTPRIGGIAAFRKFSINPYQNIRPVTGRELELEQDARVEVMLNGLTMRTMDLPAGRFRFQDFPLIPSAANDIRLRITYASGRVEELEFPAFYDFDLLNQGLTDFGVNAGVPYEFRNGQREYDTGNYNVLAYVRHGFTDTLTAGASIEADETFATLGAEVIWASPIGTFAVNLANDIRNPGLDSGQVTIQHRWRDADRVRDRSIDGFIQLTGKDFRTLNQLFGENLVSAQARVRVGQSIGPNIRAQIYGGYESYRGGMRDTYSVGIGATGSIGRFQLGGSVEYRNTQDGSDFVAQLSLAMRLGKTSVTGSYSSQNNTIRGQFTRTEPYALGAFSYGGQFERSDRRDRQSLRAGYIGNRFEASAQQVASNYFTGDAENSLVTEMRLGTAIVMADGQFALSRPVTNSFAIISSNSDVNFDIAADPQTGFGGTETNYLAKSGALGPAVINNITPYYNRRIKVEAPDAPAGTSIGGQVIALNSGYRGGYRIGVGSDANVSIVGNLVDRDGDPVSLATGTVVARDGDGWKDVGLFFTNRAGRFFIEGLANGQTIEIRLDGQNAATATLTLPGDALGLLHHDQPVVIPIDVPPPPQPEDQENGS